MIRPLIALGLVAMIATSVVGSVYSSAAAPAAPPENSIKDVMKLAHKDGLLKKIVDGEGTQEDKQKLLDLYIDMLEGTPEKGEQTEWLMAAGRSVVAAAKVSVGREGAIEELKEATNCQACHDVFK
jgi:hypothetical protein